MNPQNKKLVIFDFDGVLVNTLDFSFDLHKKDNPNFTWEKFQDFSNGNFIDGVKNAVDGGAHIIPNNFYEKYEEEIEKIDINDILHQTILSLNKDYKIAIVSSTRSSTISDFLIKENLRDCFSDILGADVHRNKTIKINNLFEKYNILPKNAVFITDSLGDIIEGNNCGVKSIGVTWGIHSRIKLEKGSPVETIDDPRDLFNSIKNVLK